MRMIAIVVHAIAGTLALAAGYSLLDRRRGRALVSVGRMHVGALVVLIISLAMAVIVDWPTLDTGAKVGFTALGVLAAFMTIRAERARRNRRKTAADLAKFVGDVGFTVVGLVDGFIVVFALELSAPVPALVALGAGIAVTGHVIISRATNQILQSV
jgi:hypothetical protein